MLKYHNATIQAITMKTLVFILFILLGAESNPVHATDYYIDPINGSDDNTGTLINSWQSFKNVISYYQSDFRPPFWVDLNPGDTIYLMDGVHNYMLNPGGDAGPADGGSYLVYFRGKYGSANNWFNIKAYPGTNPILDPNSAGLGMRIYQSSYWNISGVTVRNAYSAGEGGGIKLAEISNVKLSDIEIYDTDGVDNNNISGLHCAGCNNIEIFNSSFHDNFDRTNADTNGESTANSSNMVFFRGENISVHDSQFYNSVPITATKSGMCLKYKHASSNPDAYFNAYNNTFENCKHGSLQTGTANTNFHHNVIINSARIHSRDLGGPTHQSNQIFAYNTIYNSGGIILNPTTDWQNKDFPDDPKNIIIKNNIIYDLNTSYNQENGIINIGTYMSDDLYNLILPELNLQSNCYYNPNLAVRLNIGAANNGASYGILGGQYSLIDWQQNLGLDINSIETDPMFIDANNGDFQLSNSSECLDMGAFAVLSDLIFSNGFE